MSGFSFDFDATADEDFFGSLKSKSSKLQQLLDEDTLPEAEKQQSLKYQRPKANDLKKTQKIESASASSAASSVRTLIAKVATAYRQVQHQGKVGVALVKTAEDSLQIVIYKSKESVLATLQMRNDRQTLFKQDRYWQFYDDTTEVDWSFCFDSKQDEAEFQDFLLKNGQTFPVSQEDKKEKTNINKSEEQQERVSNNRELEDGEINNLATNLPSPEVEKVKDASKSILIKRMAKMGQPLPNLSSLSTQTTTEFSDSSDTEIIKTPLSLTQKPSIAPRSNKLATLKANQKQVIAANTMAMNTAPSYMTISNNLESQYMQMLLTEQRTHGSELRMNVQKLETKIEKVLDKLEDIDRGAMGGESKQKKHKDDEILELEEKILNLKKENRKLKQMIEQRNESETYEEQSKAALRKLRDDLMEMNIKENNDVEGTISSCLESLQTKQETIEKQQEVINKWEKSHKENEHNLQVQKDKHKNLESQLMELNKEMDGYKTQLQEKDKCVQGLEQQIQDLRQDLKAKSNECQQSPVAADVMVKNIMNNLFADICAKLTPNDCGDKDKVLALVGMSIKQQTLKALQQKAKEEH